MLIQFINRLYRVLMHTVQVTFSLVIGIGGIVMFCELLGQKLGTVTGQLNPWPIGFGVILAVVFFFISRRALKEMDQLETVLMFVTGNFLIGLFAGFAKEAPTDDPSIVRACVWGLIVAGIAVIVSHLRNKYQTIPV